MIKKKTVKWTFIAGALCALLFLTLTGCGSEASDRDFADEEYDASYLSETYAQQLLDDGAETIVGTLEVSGTEDDCTVTVHEKKIVPNEDYENGYYIADRNKETVCPLSSDLGVAAISGGETVIMETEEFIEHNSKNPDSLYTVYLIGGNAELILPLDPSGAVN